MKRIWNWLVDWFCDANIRHATWTLPKYRVSQDEVLEKADEIRENKNDI